VGNQFIRSAFTKEFAGIKPTENTKALHGRTNLLCRAFCGESPLTLRPNFNCKKGNITAGGESPLTLRPNFNCEKGSVTAAAAACSPRRGIFVGENLLYNLRVMHCRTVQVECELFSFFASFFLFSKEKKKRNSL
jgi:hypothetical protein